MPTDLPNFYHYISESLQENADKMLIRWQKENFTGKEILQQINSYRIIIRENKILPAQAVLLAMPVKPELIFAILALMAEGAIPVLPPAGANSRQLFRLLLKPETKGIFFATNNLWLKIMLKTLGLKTLVTNLTNFSASFSEDFFQVPADQAALVSHSSGSTGQPKAIIRSHQVLASQHLVLKNTFPTFENQRDFPLFPNILLHNLSSGVLSIIPDISGFDVKRMSAEIIFRQIQHEQINTLTGNVFYFTHLVQFLADHNITISHIKALGIGGSPVPEFLLEALKKYFVGTTVYVIYGSSEAEPIATRKVETVEMPFKGFCVGEVSPDLELHIEAENQINVGKDSFPVGEILVRGNHVVVEKSEKWLHTGDFGYLNEQHQLFLTARKGNEKLIKNTHHYQLEHTLLNLKGVEKVAALACDTGFKVFIVSKMLEKELRDELNQHFEEDIVSQFHFRKNLPVDNRHQSKILYKLLK